MRGACLRTTAVALTLLAVAACNRSFQTVKPLTEGPRIERVAPEQVTKKNKSYGIHCGVGSNGKPVAVRLNLRGSMVRTVCTLAGIFESKCSTLGGEITTFRITDAHVTCMGAPGGTKTVDGQRVSVSLAQADGIKGPILAVRVGQQPPRYLECFEKGDGYQHSAPRWATECTASGQDRIPY